MTSDELDPSRWGRELEGRYANYFTVGHNPVEFVFDFGQFFPEGETPYWHTRIITSPTYASRLSRMMLESLAQYEQQYGRIRGEEP
jgi:hypothetical protein